MRTEKNKTNKQTKKDINIAKKKKGKQKQNIRERQAWKFQGREKWNLTEQQS